MTPQQIENLKIEDILKLDLESLKNEQVVLRIEEIVEDSQLENEPMYARECYDVLEVPLSKLKSQIVGSEIYKRLHIVKLKLFWLALPVLEKKIKEQAFTQNIIFAYKHKINIFKPLVNYFDLYEFGVGPDYEKRQVFLYSLSHNEEQLGSQPILLKTGEKVLPLLKNWLSDFVSYSSSKSIGDTYETTNYLYSSPNIKILAKEDKEILASILGIYNWLKHPDYIPEIEKPGQTSSSIFISKSPISIPTPKSVLHGQSIDFLKSELGVNKPPSPGLVATLSQRERGNMNKPTLSPQEIKREVATPELVVNNPIKPIVPKPVVKPPIPIPSKPVLPKPDLGTKVNPAAVLALNSINDIKVLDDLKKIDIRHLRAGDVKTQTNLIKAKILFISQVNRILPFYAVQAFEQSPLFKIYLALGSQLIADRNADRKAAFDTASKNIISTGQGSLTLQEFEAVADLRKEIERL